jgi:tetratricopeptide (TPR) repeat protein
MNGIIGPFAILVVTKTSAWESTLKPTASALQLLHTLLPSTFTQRRNPDTEAGRLDLFRARLYDLLSYPYWWIKGPVPNLWTHLRHMNLAEKYPPTQAMGRAYSFHAVIMPAVPLPDRGIDYAGRSYRIHDKEADLVGKGKARSYQTFAYLTAGRFKEGVESGREALRLLEEAGDVWEANMARVILSVPLFFQGDHELAAVEARKGVRIGQETGDVSSLVIALWFWAQYAVEQVPEGLITSELDQPSKGPLSDVSIIPARALELLHREDNPREAAKFFQKGLDVGRKRGLRNPCVFCAVSWKTQALRNQRLFILNAFGADRRRKSDPVFRINTPRVRIVAEREPAGAARTVALKQARKSARHALLTTRLYLTSRPHALREKALISALEGKEAKARRYFDESFRLARQQEAAYEIASTELARGEAGLKFGWPVDEAQMAGAKQELARIREFTESAGD